MTSSERLGQPPAFRFLTKARNLEQLVHRLESAEILPLEILTVDEWTGSPSQCLARLRSSFCDERLIVRSSAPDEDSIETSYAGAFESVADVDIIDDEELADAINSVIESYRRRTREGVGHYEVLVQPMVSDVRMSGVIFTRDLERNAPYFVLNYDTRTNRTDTVTSGSSDNHEVLRVFKDIDLVHLDADVANVIRLALELESLTLSDSLDIEFAIDSNGRTYLLQVRPLTRRKILSLSRLDRKVTREIEEATAFVAEKLAPTPSMFGAKSILGEMPDWNPAEIIGTHPKPLAESLYRYLIMKSTWREARAVVGYHHPYPYQLMAVVGGRPFVDVRASFNSFLPAALPESLSEKLVDYYLARLRESPELHDKIEFEIVASCLTFDFDVHERRLEQRGFSDEEIRTLREQLRELTEDLVTDANGVLARFKSDVAQLESRRESTVDRHQDESNLPMVVEQLLEDCILYGTLPFSVFARCAFVGTAFIRSLVHRGAMSLDEYNSYVQSIDTVAGDFVEDLDSFKSGELPLETFLAQYGHLRPGTYDICTHTYSERPDLYLGLRPDQIEPTESADRRAPHSSIRSQHDEPNRLPENARQLTLELLAEHGYSFGVDELERFISSSIRQREAVKLEFTKNLSIALDLIVEFGHYHGLSREDLSFLEIEDLLRLSNQNLTEDYISHLRTLIDRNRNRSDVTAAIALPDLIFDEVDVMVVKSQRRHPNFTSNRKIIAHKLSLTDIENLEDRESLKGRIVMIENADPGYDWLFGESIAGLVTKYGGANSHMAIRCAEFGLPAAIGCGEQIFEELLAADSILLDCVEQRIEAYGR